MEGLAKTCINNLKGFKNHHLKKFPFVSNKYFKNFKRLKTFSKRLSTIFVEIFQIEFKFRNISIFSKYLFI